MTHDELLAKIDEEMEVCDEGCNRHKVHNQPWQAMRAVVELHRPITRQLTPDFHYISCANCGHELPCPTIQAIEKELT